MHAPQGCASQRREEPESRVQLGGVHGATEQTGGEDRRGCAKGARLEEYRTAGGLEGRANDRRAKHVAVEPEARALTPVEPALQLGDARRLPERSEISEIGSQQALRP